MKRYETYIKLDSKRYHFIGWYPMEDDTNCIDTKTRTVKTKDWDNGKWVDSTKTYIYKTYKYLNGDIKTYKYGTYIEEAK